MKRKLLVQCIYISVLFVKEAFLHFPEKKQPRFHKLVIQKQKLPKLLSRTLCTVARRWSPILWISVVVAWRWLAIRWIVVAVAWRWQPIRWIVVVVAWRWQTIRRTVVAVARRRIVVVARRRCTGIWLVRRRVTRSCCFWGFRWSSCRSFRGSSCCFWSRFQFRAFKLQWTENGQ